jgi:amino acid transporter
MATQTPDRGETAPLLQPPHSSQQEQEQAQEQPKLEQKQLSTRHAFAVLVSIQIGSGIFASPAQVDSNVPSPGVALLVWALGGLLSWAGAASFAELGAALPLNGGMQEYLRHVYGDTAAFLMAWIYIMAVKPSSMAIQSIVIAESVSSVTPLTPQIIKAVAVAALVFIVIINSINTKTTLRMGEAFTAVKILTVVLIVCGGFVAVVAHLADPGSRLSPSKDWYTRDWFHARTTKSESGTIDWSTIGAWERCGHYSAALYAGLWAYDGWDNVSMDKSTPSLRSLCRLYGCFLCG